MPIAMAGEAAGPTMIGYRGDGFCEERAGDPPVHWDAATGSNILWKAELPNWGLGCPIAVKDRVFLVYEPDRDSDWPTLLCLHAADGKTLWKRTMDPIPLMSLPEDQKEAVRKAWHDSLAALWTLNRMRHLYGSTTNKAEALRVLEANGCAADEKGQVTWKGDGTKRGDRVDVALARTFNRARLYFDVWHLSGMARIGYGYPTPVSDGERVYVATGMHGFWCFDFDGNVLWQTLALGQGTSNAGYGGDDFCKNARSPLLHGDLLLSDVGNLVRAFDKKTGKLLWSDKHSGHEIVTPVIVTVSGQDYLLTATVTAYRLPDGKKFRVEGWGNHGGTMLVKSDARDVVFFTGGGEHGGWENKGNPPCTTPPPAAVRFAPDDAAAATQPPSTNVPPAKLKATVLWSGMDGKSSGECHTGLVYTKSRLYHSHGHILDAETGAIVKRGDRNRTRFTPTTRHLTWLAGGRLYGVTDGSRGGRKDGPVGGICQVYDLDGKKLAENFLPVPELKDERRDRVIEIGCGGFSYGCPFTIAGDRLYIRGNTVLYCVGRK
jgi:outer membrane protein assembly factor BamB